jgi:hypothetical protein
LGIGDWGLGPIPNPQSPIPNPQSPRLQTKNNNINEFMNYFIYNNYLTNKIIIIKFPEIFFYSTFLNHPLNFQKLIIIIFIILNTFIFIIIEEIFID